MKSSESVSSIKEPMRLPPKDRRFCRRCLTWHPTSRASAREELVKLDGAMVLMDFVLCDPCAARSDHAKWYRARAMGRLRTMRVDSSAIPASC